MGTYARLAAGETIDILPTDRPASNFDLVDGCFEGLPSLRRILSQARVLGYKTLVSEGLPEAGDLREENEDLRKRCGGLRSSMAVRLGLFSKRFRTWRGLHTARNEDFLGYVIVKIDDIPSVGKRSRVYESVLRPSRHDNNFVRGTQTWPCQVGGNRFEVDGYVYAQQNGLTNICAHVALRSAAARFHPAGDMSYREMNKLLGVDHTTARWGIERKGMSFPDMLRVLRASGAECFSGEYPDSANNFPDSPFQKFIYGSVESGYPAIAMFGTVHRAGHAIPFFGHTFNEDTWVPSAERAYFTVGPQTRYIPSESWVSMYLAHDDNFGSNFCVPRGYLHELRQCAATSQGFCDQDLQKCDIVVAAVGTLPGGVAVDPIEAEVIGADYLSMILKQERQEQRPYAGVWAARLDGYEANHMLVYRPILVDKWAYLSHLKTIRDWDYRGVTLADQRDLAARTPDDMLWLVELSIPELFSANRRKLAEVVLHAGIDPGTTRSMSNFVHARLPGSFVLYKGGGPPNPEFRFRKTRVQGHVELFGTEGK